MKLIKVELERKEIREIIINLEQALMYVKEKIEELEKLITKRWEQYQNEKKRSEKE